MNKLIFCCILLFLSFQNTISSQERSVYKDSLEMEKVIERSLYKAESIYSEKPIMAVIKVLDKKQGNIWGYWKSFTLLYLSYFYEQQKEPSKAKRALETAASLIESESEKTTEDYALLAYIQCLSIQYAKGMECGVLSTKSRNNAKRAVREDPDNLRGWLVLGVLDYFTPRQLGGKELCEEYFMKAIQLKARKSANPYRPGWGKPDAYQLLMDYYLECGEKGKARNVYQMAVKEFPDTKQWDKYGKEF